MWLTHRATPSISVESSPANHPFHFETEADIPGQGPSSQSESNHPQIPDPLIPVLRALVPSAALRYATLPNYDGHPCSRHISLWHATTFKESSKRILGHHKFFNSPFAFYFNLFFLFPLFT